MQSSAKYYPDEPKAFGRISGPHMKGTLSQRFSHIAREQIAL
jgi:hypothetical protein